jgi:23S rRNA pseudouridine2605 synthase
LRINVFLQQAGIGSRREAERLIGQGRVTVNGNPAQVTTPVDETDVVAVDGKPVSAATKALPRLYMLNKPLDFLCTTYDSQGRPTIFDLPVLKPRANMPRLMNVGRLDVNSEGLLMMSSDGPLAQAMMSPKTALERIYRVRVHGRLSDHDLRRLSEGVTVKGVRYRGAKVYEEKQPTGRNTWYRVVLTEGKNREIRKLMEYFGCVVNRLIRLQYGPFELGDMKPGELREVPARKVERLIEDLQKRGANIS